MRTRRLAVPVLLLSIGALAIGLAKAEERGDQALGEGLIRGLLATEGCLGVKTARLDDGKQCIFAWFEDRSACMDWYYSDTHQVAMDIAVDLMAYKHREPMMPVEDGHPILCIASITPSDSAEVEGLHMSVSQISIELYRPVPGGASFGGTFAPTSLEIPHHRRGSWEEEAVVKDE